MARGEKRDEGKGGGSVLGLAFGVLLASAVAAGGGVYLGSAVLGKAQAPAAGGKPDAGKPEVKYADGSKLVFLQPVMTNLAGSGSSWIRLEAAAVLSGDPPQDDIGKLTAMLGEDLVAYMRTVSLAQVEGATGFQTLREDLDERVRIRSEGAVKELIIQSLVVE